MSAKRKVIVAVLIIGLSIASWVYFTQLRTGPSMEKREATARLSAVELYDAFDTDEMAANELYLNQVIEVTGKVSDVKMEADEKAVIALETNGFGVISCTMQDVLSQSGELLVGKEMKIKGECIGLLLDVLLVESIIVEE